jgi:hypothetical protein
MLGLGVTNAQLFATVSNSSSQSIYHAQVVAVDGLPATLHVGEKYPIITSGYFGNKSGSGTVYTPPPTINFEDLGLLIKVTAHVASVDEVTLDLDAEFKLLGATSSNGIPVVATVIPILSYIPLLRQNTISKDQGATLIVLKPHVTIAPPSASAAWRAWAGTETRVPPEL